MSASKVIRWAGLSLVLAGILSVVTQLIHPPNEPASVSTSSWAIAHYLLLGSAVFSLLGVAGLYARQVEETGLLGLVGYVVLFVGLALVAGLAFLEAFVMPAITARGFVDAFFAGEGLGALGSVFPIVILLYSIGGILFGIALARGGVSPRWAAILVVITSVVFLVSIALPEIVLRISAGVSGLAVIWLGFALWSESPEKAMEPSPAV